MPITLVALAAALAAAGPAFEERVVAGGGAGDFMEVRHAVLRGTSFEIGKKLAEIAKERFGSGPSASRDRTVTRAQREFLARNWPAQLERMRGVAAFHAGDPDDDATDYSSLPYLLGPPGGCSVFFVPPSRMKGGAGVLSRNYDFTTGTIDGRAASKDAPACTSRPIVLETHPTGGAFSSIAVVSYDLLGAAIDGINSEGLAVALLADDEVTSRFTTEPTREPAVGLCEIEVPRFLLDTCATAKEARAALLATRQYYSFVPCHYIVADRHGDSFVFEWSPVRNRAHVIDGGGAPQISTNFMLHLHPPAKGLPEESAPYGNFARYAAIAASIGGREPLGLDDIRDSAARVAAREKAGPDRPAGRTLWHALYFPEARKVEIDFYLGEGGDDGRGRRSGYVEFALRE